MPPPPYCVYFLGSLSNPRQTYIGCTNNLKRRLHQHNHTKKGARYTSRARPWRIAGVLGPFWTRRQALSVEWRAKHVKYRRGSGVEARLLAVLCDRVFGEKTRHEYGLYDCVADKRIQLPACFRRRPKSENEEKDMTDEILHEWQTLIQ